MWRAGILLLGLTATACIAAARHDDIRTRHIMGAISAELGGKTTRVDESPNAFTFLIGNAGEGYVRPFQFGNRLFNTNWVAAPASVTKFDGLGPLFNRVSCSGCHLRDGRGQPPEETGAPMDSMLVRLSVPGVADNGGPLPHPAYGGQLNDRAIMGVTPEGRAIITYTEIAGQYGDGTKFSLRRPDYIFQDLAYGSLEGALFSPRVAPHMIGLGLLEAVPDELLEALADPNDEDGDGISGRINRVFSPSAGKTLIGRFGWKANVANLVDQSSGAALGDIGLTSPVHPQQNCTEAAPDCLAAFAQPPEDGPELSAHFLERIVFYTQTLAVPRQRGENDAGVRAGETAFRDFGCAACHMPMLETAEAQLPELAHQTFHPFTDLLVHDMGPALADGRPDFEASGSEWRTAPLWGLGLLQTTNGHQFLLHDGRARGFAEAILWHGGEAENAREAFRQADAETRAALIAFLSSL